MGWASSRSATCADERFGALFSADDATAARIRADYDRLGAVVARQAARGDAGRDARYESSRP